MKKLLLSAAFAIAALAGYAQSGSAPVSPNNNSYPNPGPGLSDCATVLVCLELKNIIEICPPIDVMCAKFDCKEDYNCGEELEDFYGHKTSNFTVSSNRDFNVTIKSSSPNFLYVGSGVGNTIMPSTVLKYNLHSNGTGGTNATPMTWNPLTVAAAPLINSGTHGCNKPFSLKFKADPGWDFAAGSYGIGVILTATQL
ncbi:hypothetical protein HF324_21215 [Chitinophaga oryzae]|uniref:Uncharacterized protein n=1 Tax=Chitinophaga oryzae TaxID=2725414 RepID=A0AAE6ZJD7_9BACT|nr:hypothetical protein [Chitinophaga oryzae]QJB33717.1 hypothetical protein HF329_21325 [Chitinophaga oryzae]QJB40241.1 hypothetical protein HF324_21215 [Chitinophaga oryzae]